MKTIKLHGCAARLPGRISALGSAAVIASLLSIGSAGAVTLGFSGPHTTALPGGSNGYSLPAVDGLGVGTIITYLGTGESGGLTVDSNAKLIFEFVGTEAGFNNLLVLNGSINLANHGSHPTSSFTSGPGTVPFYFQANLPGGTNKAINGGTISSNLLLGFFQVSSTIVYALFDDGGGGPPSDKDFDDFVVKITACPAGGCQPGGSTSPTPLPGAVWLFGSVLAGAGGFGGWRRRRAKRAAPAAA